MYMVFDLETTIYESMKRKANPFDDRNWIVAQGWKLQGDTDCSWAYHKEKSRSRWTAIPECATMLVGHNIKFDLLWEMEMGNPDLKAFLKRGGRIWDTQYVEYLLRAQVQEVQMISLNELAPQYGGTEKVDAVKALWEQGVQTYDIPEDLLIDYLVGTEEEKRNGGDIGNTELIFLQQVSIAHAQGMTNMIMDRMDGLLATTEMEFRGLKIDVAEAGRRLKVLTADLDRADKELMTFIPTDVPFEFNWNSPIHASALIFGGTVKYQKQAPYKNENGEWARYKATAKWPLFSKEPIDPDDCEFDDAKEMYFRRENITLGGGQEHDIVWQDTNLSGKNKGAPKFRSVPVQGEIKVKYQDFLYEFPGYTEPRQSWATSRLDGNGAPVYSTSSEVMEALAKRDMPFTKALGEKQKLDKEIGTYYVRYDPKKGYVGMLSCVQTHDHIIHHNLNHAVTVTTRLSSSNPNLQNLPRNDKDDAGVEKSQVKTMFVSRFGADGYMIEADYSQLEVVVQGVLSGDPQLCQDLRDRIDFHCKRVGAKHHISYQEAVDWCKNGVSMEALEASGYVGKVERTKCKIFSFQRAYGAGVATVAEETGMTEEETRDLFDAEDALYPGVVAFNKNVEAECHRSAKPFQALNENTGQWQTFRRGYWVAPTGTRYSWRTYPAQEWQAKRGIKDSFNPPEMKNYPIQGTGGEFVQAILGLLIRKFIETDNYGGKAFLVNTVHDCVWIDAHKDVYNQVCSDIKPIMESIPEYYNNRYGMNITVPFPVEVEYGENMNSLEHWKEAA